MEDGRDLLIALGRRLLLALPFALAGWLLFATGGGAERRILGLLCVVIAGIVVAPPLAGLIAEPAGGLFHPRHPARQEPSHDIAEARRRQGRYAEALDAYERVVERFPGDVSGWIAMLDVASVDLRDAARADAIARRALAALPDAASRMQFLQARRRIHTAEGAALAAPSI